MAVRRVGKDFGKSAAHGMKVKWLRVPFSEAVLINPFVPLTKGENYSFVEMKDLVPNDRYVRPARERELTGGSRFYSRDTLFARITPCLENGKIAQVIGLEGGVGFGSTEFIVMRGKPDITDTDFVHYLNISEPVRRHAEMSMSGTSGRQRVDTSAFDKLIISFPPLPIQKRIAEILGALDDKIDCNRRINKTLEHIAMALYKHWFVDFGPFRHGEFVDSELGRIPKGWGMGTLGDVAENPRRTVNLSDVEPATPYIGLEHMPRCSIALNDWGQADEVASGKTRFKKGEILFGKLRPYFHKVGIAPIDGVCSTDILTVKPKLSEWYSFVLCLISGDDIIDYADANSTGTKMPRVSWADLARYKVALPSIELAAKFNLVVQQMLDKISANIMESRTLAAIRDALLPKLLSGEIKITSDTTSAHL